MDESYLKISPTTLTKELNSTPLGKICGHELVSQHLKKAGSKISGDSRNKRVNLFKYTAWLLNKRNRKTSPQKNKSAYEETKRVARQKSLERSAVGRDIGDIPDVIDPRRRELCRLNLRLYLETYYPKTFYFSWSSDQLCAITKIENSILHGGMFAMAMPRGTGKTSLCESACSWAIVYGHRKYIALIGSTDGAAKQLLDEIKIEFETNEDLYDDFPEVCFPIVALDGINNRCAGQTCKGERTRISWTDKRVIMPTVNGSQASGAIIQATGITGRVRGMKYHNPDGGTFRPDFAIIDDPQTDESARSFDQNKTRTNLIAGAILGLAGPGIKMGAVMPCTVIKPGDMIDQILDKKVHPEWNGERRKMLLSFPDDMKIWNKYNEVMADSYRDGNGIAGATKFYKEHREEMDKGAKVSWEKNFTPDELSGIQHAMNLYFRDEQAFFAEYQNEPIPETNNSETKITLDNVFAKMNGLKRNEIPDKADHLIMYIDVQGKLLYWGIIAVSDNFTAWVIDYGGFPHQQQRYFTLRKANPNFETVYTGMGLEGKIRRALDDLTGEFLGKQYVRNDGLGMKIECCLVDSGWGESTDAVYDFAKESVYSSIIYSAKGKGITAAQKPFTEYKKQVGTRLGFNWRIYKVAKKSARLFEYDTNFFKSFFRQRLFTPIGDPGSLTIWGKNIEQHRMLAEHWTSEISVLTSAGSRKVDIWTLIPNRDNHLLDFIVGAYAAASHAGCKLQYKTGPKTLKPQKRLNYKRHITAGKTIKARI